RLDIAHRALTIAALNALLADLPVQQNDAVVTPPTRTPAPSSHVREHQVIAAVMGGAERRGHWLPAKRTLVVSTMGGALLDFREVQLPPGETEVTVICMMGGTEIIVPPGMNIDSGGIAIMGGFEHVNTVPSAQDRSAAVLRINGFVLMGGVEVYVRLPGESAKDARHRVRNDRRRLRDERRGR
ncbi:MAG: hypothetical protein ACT4O1_11360, partial [Gemmatimonadota bacterium]